MLAAWFFQVEYQWDGMQRYYLAHYVVSSAGLSLQSANARLA